MTCTAARATRPSPEAEKSAGRISPDIDTRLVAAVQTHAGARVHEAAGLLNTYFLWSQLLAQADEAGNRTLAREAMGEACKAKWRLRQFLVPPQHQ